MANPPKLTRTAAPKETPNTTDTNRSKPPTRKHKRPAPNDENSRDNNPKRTNTGSRSHHGSTNVRPASVSNDDGRGQHEAAIDELTRKVTAMEEALEKEKAHNAELQEKLNEGSELQPVGGTEKDAPAMIPRPKGTAGTNFSIQEEMGLSGSSKNYDKYKAIQRNIRDLTLNARINWEQPWTDIPAKDKALLFDIARKQNPFLVRFVNDWATEELVKQYTKNKRKNHYKNGWLDVPEKYAYLRDNASKRDPSGSRKKRGLTNARRATTRKEGGTTGGKKRRVPERVVQDNDDEEGSGNGEDDEFEGEEDGVGGRNRGLADV